MMRITLIFIILITVFSLGYADTPIGVAGNINVVDLFNYTRLNERRIVIDGNNRLHAVYWFQVTGGGGDTYNIYYSRSDDGGLTWSEQLIATASTAINEEILHPAIAVNNAAPNPVVFIVYARHYLPAGVSNVVWRRGLVGAGATDFAMFGAEQVIAFDAGYTAPTGVTAGTSDFNLFIDSGLRMHLAWRYIAAANNKQICYTWSDDFVNWNTNAVVYLDAIAGTSEEMLPFMDEDPTGRVHIIWSYERTAGLLDFDLGYEVKNVGESFNDTQVLRPGISGGAGALWYPSLAFDSALVNNMHVVYGYWEGANKYVRYQQGLAGGPIDISTGTNSYASVMGITIQGTQREIPVVTYCDETAQIIYLTYKNSDTSFSAPTDISSASGPNRTHPNIIPLITNDQTSVLWYSQVAADYRTYHWNQPDIIAPYKPDEGFLNPVISANYIQGLIGDVQQIWVTLTDINDILGDAVEVQYYVRENIDATLHTSGWTISLNPPNFTNIRDNQTVDVWVVARDALGNQSLESTHIVLTIPDTMPPNLFNFTWRRPPIPADWGACAGSAIGNYFSIEWSEDYLPNPDDDADIYFYLDDDNVSTNGGVGWTYPPAPANALSHLLPSGVWTNAFIREEDEIDSTIVDLSVAPADGPYYLYAYMTGSVGVVDAYSVPFTIDVAPFANEPLPQITITNPDGVNDNTTDIDWTNFEFPISYVYADDDATTVYLAYDTDTNFANGYTTINPTAPINHGAGSGNNTYDWYFLNAPAGALYILGIIDDGTCTTYDYSGVPLNLNIFVDEGEEIYGIPNPFSPLTGIPYGYTSRIIIRQDTPHSCKFYIFDTHGKIVYRRDIASAVNPNFIWDGRDYNGRILPNGIYIMRALQTDTKDILTGRITILDK